MSNETQTQYILREPEAAVYLSLSRQWLRLKRTKGQHGGPPYIKAGRSVLYDVRDLDAWLQANRVEA